MIQDFEDLRLADPDRRLGLLGVVDEDHAPARGRDERGSGHEPDGALVAVNGDRGTLVDLFDLLGDVGQQIVG